MVKRKINCAKQRDWVSGIIPAAPLTSRFHEGHYYSCWSAAKTLDRFIASGSIPSAVANASVQMPQTLIACNAGPCMFCVRRYAESSEAGI